MEINNKFSIGEKVYTVKRNDIFLECKMCNGNGQINYEGYELKCPACKGAKIVPTGYKIWEVVGDCSIRRIKASIGENGSTIKYLINSRDFHINSRPEYHLFKTEEEAEEFCKLNNK